MTFSLMHDEQLLQEIGSRIDHLRREKALPDVEFTKLCGISLSTLNRFRSGKGISLINFIRLLRGLGILDRLDRMLEVNASYSPATGQVKEPPKRIRSKPVPRDNKFVWGEDN